MSGERDRFQKRVEALVEGGKRLGRAARVGHQALPEEDARRRPSGVRDPGPLPSKGPTRVLLDPVAYDVPGAESL